MTLQERLRFVELKQGGMRIQDHNALIRTAADALDAQTARIKELEGALAACIPAMGEYAANRAREVLKASA
jgi:hypothetical protein